MHVARPGAIGRAGKLEDFLLRPFGRVEPVVAQGIELLCGFGDGRFLLRRGPGEGEGLEAGGGGVARARLQPRPQPERPDLVDSGVQNAEEVVVGAGEDDELAVRHRGRGQPHKQPVLRDAGRCQEARQWRTSLAQLRALGVELPPLRAVP